MSWRTARLGGLATAAVPEVAPGAEATTEAPVAAPTKTKGRAPKAGKAMATTKAKTAAPAVGAPTATPGSLRSIGDAWIEALRADGHSRSTVSSYGNDLEVAHEFFGDILVAEITERRIAAFNASKGVVTKKNGKPKAKPTILKTRRALRLSLTWAVHNGLIKQAPYPAKTPA